MRNVGAKDKMEFVYAMAKHSNASLADCQRLLRYGASLGRFAENACNRELTEKEIYKNKVVKTHVCVILDSIDCKPVFSGDPRGCVLKIAVPDGYSNSWGGEGICVPTS